MNRTNTTGLTTGVLLGNESADHSMYHVPEIDKIYGTISFISGFMGFVGNIVIMKILLQHRRSLSAKLFLAIAYNDVLTSLFGAIPFSIPRLFTTETSGLFGVEVLCNLCGATLNISERYSVFLIAVLSVTRACALKYPLLHIKQNRILFLMGLYLAVQACLACLPFVKGKFYYYDDVYTVCTWTLDDIIDFETQYIYYQLTYYSLLFVPFFLPSIFVVTSCFFCVLSLNKSVVSSNDQNKAKASMTIVLFTLTYIVLHVPIWIFLVLFLIDEHGKVSVNFADTTPLYLFIFSSKVSVFINAALNPLIYMGRVSSMKQSFKEDVLKARGRLSSMKRSLTRKRLVLPARIHDEEEEGQRMIGASSHMDDNARVFDGDGANMAITPVITQC